MAWCLNGCGGLVLWRAVSCTWQQCPVHAGRMVCFLCNLPAVQLWTGQHRPLSTDSFCTELVMGQAPSDSTWTGVSCLRSCLLT